ncbi:hypothetical protein CH333_09090 [candidate division WOR-3 bacterium JGI_Cruoil_03_44_89]|uniref:Uncharacterized protein n=1 Tax=candidate division WOR-3 bacterium JGI_Cruoil_03_44_89 TaxID=1973748 RepID=A0A235BNJ9_UNCW3|nr:MAG: hypothetical protein CH333_09090 [candidate division WOR-3 bacterium JGI_Cruoil_03_44_89]
MKGKKFDIKSGIRICLILLSITFGCVTYPTEEKTLAPPKGEEIKRILENIGETSFRVKIELSRQGVRSTMSGEYDKRGRKRIKSEWEIGGKKTEREILVVDNKTFSKEGGKWIEGGGERLPYELVLTVTSFGDFSFVGREKGCLAYGFTPNLLFISPTIESARAQICVDERSLLPVNIVATGDGCSFRADFSCFGENIKIEHPLSKIYETEISPIPDVKDMDIITERILSIGADDCWLRNDRLYIKIPETNERDIKKVLKRGMLDIYTVSESGVSPNTAKDKYNNKLVFLNETHPVLIDSLLYEDGVESVEFFEGEVMGDRMVLKFADDLTVLIPFVVCIDDRPVSFLQKFCGREMDIRGDRVDYSILKFGPLSREYAIK